MTGFIVTPEQASAILAAIEAAQTSRGLSVYWTPGAFPVLRGDHESKAFIPFDDAMMTTNLRGGMTPMDFPETAQLLAMLGGLDARMSIDPADITAESAT